MLRLTLDTCCLIDVDPDEPNREQAPFVRELQTLHQLGEIDISLGASSASERQRGKIFLKSAEVFRERADQLGFDGVRLLPPIMRWDISFWDLGVWANDEMVARENEISRALFPNRDTNWADTAKSSGVNVDDFCSEAYLNWRNQLLDVQAYWAHEFDGRDVFVTSDRNFSKRLVGHPRFAQARIATPEEAIEHARFTEEVQS